MAFAVVFVACSDTRNNALNRNRAGLFYKQRLSVAVEYYKIDAFLISNRPRQLAGYLGASRTERGIEEIRAYRIATIIYFLLRQQRKRFSLGQTNHSSMKLFSHSKNKS